ncbi:hypothetical protein FJZ33_10780 [Candidatus Poribacteria bacterium]|nr:hypothetical protein [Candidatus Poribacteria bacterium]
MKILKTLFVSSVLLIFLFVSFSFADVKYVGEDKKTLGDWPGVYGKNGVVIFQTNGDLKDLKDITNIKDNGQRWNWANPTQDKRGAVYPNDPKSRAGSCIFNNPVGTINIETKLKDYQLAIYAVDWDSSARVQDMSLFQGNKPPQDPHVTVINPAFNAGIYLIWRVTGSDPVTLQVVHKGGANWVFTGLFLDALSTSVEGLGKLATTWGDIRK